LKNSRDASQSTVEEKQLCGVWRDCADTAPEPSVFFTAAPRSGSLMHDPGPRAFIAWSAKSECATVEGVLPVGRDKPVTEQTIQEVGGSSA
jgi:hypothetical protein